MESCCNEGADGEIDSSWRVEEDDVMISSFGGDSVIWAFGTDSCFNEGLDGETDSSSRVEEDDGMTLMTLGFSGVTTDYEKWDISRFIAGIDLVNADW